VDDKKSLMVYPVRARDAHIRVTRHPSIIAQSSQPHNTTNMDPINAAIEEIESLGPGKTFSYQNIAKKYGVVRSTLTRRNKAIAVLHNTKILNQQKLTQQ
jgi:predicted DNA-binding protein (UPF0251 family)